jgi:hypothetical protein
VVRLELASGAGDAGGDMRHPVAEGGDFAARQLGMVGEAGEVGQATRSVAAMMISRQANAPRENHI